MISAPEKFIATANGDLKMKSDAFLVVMSYVLSGLLAYTFYIDRNALSFAFFVVSLLATLMTMMSVVIGNHNKEVTITLAHKGDDRDGMA